MNFKIIGSILMLLGTCIGAGMLALPLAAAQFSFNTTLFFLFSSWLLMTIGAFALLEVNLWMPTGSNLFTMSRNTLGATGNTISLIIYLLLLYSLIAAYISGCSDLLQGIADNYGYVLANWYSTLIVFAVLVSVVIFGISFIDVTNRCLMFVKVIALTLMMNLMFDHFNVELLSTGSNAFYSMQSFMVMITAFGFAIILPSIRDYLEDNQKNIILTLAIGCLIPLVVYGVWIYAVHGLLPKNGTMGLLNIASATNPNSELIEAIAGVSGQGRLTKTSTVFITIAAITSFLGVALCLVDFMRDIVTTIYHTYFYDKELEHELDKKFKSHDYAQSIAIYLLSFSVPLVIVLFIPGIFITALSYAGILVLAFLVVIPLLMVYIGRYQLDYVGRRLIPGGKISIIGLLFISSLILLYSIIEIVI